MRGKTIAIVAGAATLLVGGLFAGTVIGDDGANEVAERLDGDFGEPRVEVARRDASATAGATATATKKRRGGKKPKVAHLVTSVATIEQGGNDLVEVRCPRRFPTPLSAGLVSSIPGIFPSILGRGLNRRSMLVAAVNATGESAGQWQATIVCAKRIKEA